MYHSGTVIDSLAMPVEVYSGPPFQYKYTGQGKQISRNWPVMQIIPINHDRLVMSACRDAGAKKIPVRNANGEVLF